MEVNHNSLGEFSMALLREAKSLFMALGPDNPLVRVVLKAICRRYNAKLFFSDRCIEVVKGQRTIRLAKQHMPYAVDMSSSFEHYFEPVVPDVLNGQYVVDYSRPRLQRYKQSGLTFELSSFPEETSAIDGYFRWYRPKPGDIVFDIGAYCGVSTYYLSKLAAATVTVYAFEPDQTNYELLLRNIKRHQLANVTAVPLGIAGNNGMAEFHAEGALGSGLARTATRGAAGCVTKIETVTLEEACRRFGVPAFAKVDIEGAEIEMLAAARDFIRSHKVSFALDTNHYVHGVLTHTPVERIFHECGYDVFSSSDSGFMTTWARPSSSCQPSSSL